MTILNIKVHGVDDTNGSIIVSFSTDNSIHPVDDYQLLSFQPTSANSLDPDQVMQFLAKIGSSVARLQDNIDATKNNPTYMDQYKPWVGQTFQIPASNIQI
jgi:hypothetical protein